MAWSEDLLTKWQTHQGRLHYLLFINLTKNFHRTASDKFNRGRSDTDYGEIYCFRLSPILLLKKSRKTYWWSLDLSINSEIVLEKTYLYIIEVLLTTDLLRNKTECMHYVTCHCQLAGNQSLSFSFILLIMRFMYRSANASQNLIAIDLREFAH